jgi:hypothetical protein
VPRATDIVPGPVADERGMDPPAWRPWQALLTTRFSGREGEGNCEASVMIGFTEVAKGLADALPVEEDNAIEMRGLRRPGA